MKSYQVALIQACLLLLSIGCNKESISIPESVSEPEKKLIEEARNDLNPFDNIGRLHNEGLDFIINNVDDLTKENAEEKIVALTNKFMAMKGEKDRLTTNELEKLRTCIAPNPNDPCSGCIKDIFCDLMKRTLDMDDPFLILKEVKNFEEKVLSEKDKYQEEEFEKILISTSVLRYSNAYWNIQKTASCCPAGSSAYWNIQKISPGFSGIAPSTLRVIWAGVGGLYLGSAGSIATSGIAAVYEAE